MKKITVIISLVVTFNLCCLPVFADSIFLKSGKSLEGTIIMETDTYVTIQYAGVPLKYWKEDIARIQRSGSDKSAKFYSERSASKEDGVLKITIKEDPAQEITPVVKTLDALRSEITGAANDARNKFVIGEDGHLTEASRTYMKEAEDAIDTRIVEMKKIHVPTACRELWGFALKAAEAEMQHFSGVANNFSTIDELKAYWEKYPAITVGQLKKKYEAERARILSQYNIELPPV